MGPEPRKRKLDHNTTNRRIAIGWQLLYLSVSFILGYVVSSMQRNRYNYSTSLHQSSTGCLITIGDSKYKGTQYTTEATLGTPKCLVESKFMKVQQHRVQQLVGGTTPTTPDVVIEDWLWIDYHDRINVLIEAPPPTTTTADATKRKNNNINSDDEPHFIILQQTKYALEGKTSLAIVGGIIEPGETPDHAAQREVWEETGHTCDQYYFLGRYRTDVNRGMGWTNTYLATSCTRQPQQHQQQHAPNVINDNEVVGKADTEQQTLMTMSLTEVRNAVMAGKFLEIQWSAAVALAMLFYNEPKVK